MYASMVLMNLAKCLPFETDDRGSPETRVSARYGNCRTGTAYIRMSMLDKVEKEKNKQ